MGTSSLNKQNSALTKAFPLARFNAGVSSSFG